MPARVPGQAASPKAERTASLLSGRQQAGPEREPEAEDTRHRCLPGLVPQRGPEASIWALPGALPPQPGLVSLPLPSHSSSVQIRSSVAIQDNAHCHASPYAGALIDASAGTAFSLGIPLPATACTAVSSASSQLPPPKERHQVLAPASEGCPGRPGGAATLVGVLRHPLSCRAFRPQLTHAAPPCCSLSERGQGRGGGDTRI